MEHRRKFFNLKNKQSSSASSISHKSKRQLNLGTNPDYSHQRRTGESSIPSADELLQTFSPSNKVGRQMFELELMQFLPRNRTQQQQSSLKLTPHPPTWKPESSMKFEKRGRQELKRGSMKSKSPLKKKFRRLSKSPAGSRQIQNSKSTPHNFKADLQTVPVSKKLSTNPSPISTLEQKQRQNTRSKSQVSRKDQRIVKDRRVVFMPTETDQDDKKRIYHGRFASEYFPQKQEGVKLFHNFVVRKVILHWQKEIQQRRFYRRKQVLSNQLWISRGLFAKTANRMKGYIANIQNIQWLSLYQGQKFGYEQQDFNNTYNQSCNLALRKYEQNTEKLIDIIGEYIHEHKRILESDQTDIYYKSITNQLEMKNKKKAYRRRAGLREKELREGRLLLFQQLASNFMRYIYYIYSHSVVDMLAGGFEQFVQIMKTPEKVEFHFLLTVDNGINLTPDIKNLIGNFLGCSGYFQKIILSNRLLQQFSQQVSNLVKFNAPKKEQVKYIEERILDMAQISEFYEANEKDILMSVNKCKHFVRQFKQIKENISLVDEWIKMLNTTEPSQFIKQNLPAFINISQLLQSLPDQQSKIGILVIITKNQKEQLQVKLQKIQKAIRSDLAGELDLVSKELLQNLEREIRILQEKPTSITQFVAQSSTLKSSQEENLEKWTQQLGYAQQCNNMCIQLQVKTGQTIIDRMNQCSSLIQMLPQYYDQCIQHYYQNKQLFNVQLEEQSQSLSRKIQRFSTKYKARYLFDSEKLKNASKALQELYKRQEAIDSIQEKVITYENLWQAFAQIENQSVIQKELKCRTEFNCLISLHSDTLKLWNIAQQWRTKMSRWLETPFTQLRTVQIEQFIHKMSILLQSKQFTSDLYQNASFKVIKSLNEEIEEFQNTFEIIKMLKQPELKPYHWEHICKILRKPHYINIPFTLQDLVDARLNQYTAKIQDTLKEAIQESKQEDTLVNIKSVWQDIQIQTEPYRNRLDTFIIKDIQDLIFTIEEHMTTMRNLQLSVNSEAVNSEIKDWFNRLQTVKTVLDLWQECQTRWLFLEPVYSSAILQETLPQEFEQFKIAQQRMKSQMWNVHSNNKGITTFLSQQIQQELQEIISEFSQIQKSLKTYLESRRTNFPRFFFLSDSELFEFFQDINSQQYTNQSICSVFPGVSQLYIKKVESNRKSPALDSDIDIDIAPFNMFSPAANELLDPFQFTNSESEGLKSPLQNSEISDEPTIYEDRDDHIVAKQRRLRDKYDDAVVEIGGNYPFEILGLIGRNKDLLLFERSVSISDQVEMWLTEVEKLMKETLSKMISYSVATFPKQSLDEWVLDFPQQVIYSSILLILTHEITELMEDQVEEQSDDENIPSVYEDHFSKVFFLSAAQSESVDQSRAYLMKFLQAKSYKGLYLRLQFWVNQLSKSIQLDTKQTQTQLHVMLLSSYINLLNYQRDIVGGLLEKNITNVNDFEWQKLVRIYWSSNDNICKLECGGLRMIQGNEYLGSSYRLLCTPVTTKYFIFISSAIRESSSVLFRSNQSHDLAGDFYQEFASLCGMGSQSIIVSNCTNIQYLMQSLNGAALANIWTIFEKLDLLTIRNLQTFTKEIQMVQQQFIIAELGAESDTESQEKSQEQWDNSEKVLPTQVEADAADGTCIQRSGVDTYTNMQNLQKKPDTKNSSDDSTQTVKNPLKSPQSMFIVLASVTSFVQNRDAILQNNLKLAFRSLGALRPDYTMLLNVMLVKEHFRYFQQLALLTKSFISSMIERFKDFHFPITSREISILLMIAGQYRNKILEQYDLNFNLEKQAIAKACHLIFTQKLITISKLYPDLKYDSNMIKELIAISFGLSESFQATNYILKQSLEQNQQLSQLQANQFQIQKALQMADILQYQKCVLITGPKYTGKSAIINLLHKAMQQINRDDIYKYVIYPNSLSQEQIFGSQSPSENNQKGILDQIFSRCTSRFDQQWVILECFKIQNWWVDWIHQVVNQEPYSSQMSQWDQIQSLTSQVPQRIRLPNFVCTEVPQNSFFFIECEQLKDLDPTMTTKIGIVNVNEEDFDYTDQIFCKFQVYQDKFFELGYESQWNEAELHDNLVATLTIIQKQFNCLKQWNFKNLVVTLLNCFEAQINSIVCNCANYENSNIKQQLLSTLVLSIVWSFGIFLSGSNRKKLLAIIRSNKNFEFFVECCPDDDIFKVKLNQQSQVLESIPSQQSFNMNQDMFIPTTQFNLFMWIFDQNVKWRQSPSQMCIQGQSSSGKSYYLKRLQYENKSKQKVIFRDFNMVQNATKVQQLINNNLLQTGFNSVHAKDRQNILMLIDDLNISNQTEPQIPALFLSWCRLKGFIDTKSYQFKLMEDINFVVTTRKAQEDLDLDIDCTIFNMLMPGQSIFRQYLTVCFNRENFLNKEEIQTRVNDFAVSYVSLFFKLKNQQNISFNDFKMNFQDLAQKILEVRESETEKLQQIARSSMKDLLSSIGCDQKELYDDNSQEEILVGDILDSQQGLRSSISVDYSQVRSSILGKIKQNRQYLENFLLTKKQIQTVWKIANCLRNKVILIESEQSFYEYLLIAAQIIDYKFIHILQVQANGDQDIDKSLQQILFKSVQDFLNNNSCHTVIFIQNQEQSESLQQMLNKVNPLDIISDTMKQALCQRAKSINEIKQIALKSMYYNHIVLNQASFKCNDAIKIRIQDDQLQELHVNPLDYISDKNLIGIIDQMISQLNQYFIKKINSAMRGLSLHIDTRKYMSYRRKVSMIETFKSIYNQMQNNLQENLNLYKAAKSGIQCFNRIASNQNTKENWTEDASKLRKIQEQLQSQENQQKIDLQRLNEELNQINSNMGIIQVKQLKQDQSYSQIIPYLIQLQNLELDTMQQEETELLYYICQLFLNKKQKLSLDRVSQILKDEKLMDVLSVNQNDLSQELIQLMLKPLPSYNYQATPWLEFYEWLDCVQQRWQIQQLIKSDIQQLQQLNVKQKQFENNLKLLHQQQKEIKRQIQSIEQGAIKAQLEQQFSQIFQTQSSQNQDLLSFILKLQQKLDNKIEFSQNLQQNLIGDSLSLAMLITYLSIISNKDIWKVVSFMRKLLEANNIQSSLFWNSSQRQKYFKLVLKSQGLTSSQLFRLKDYYLHMIQIYLSPKLPIIVDHSWQLNQIIKSEFNAKSICCSSYSINKDLSTYLNSDTSCIIQEIADNQLNYEQDNWKIGKGLCSQNLKLQLLWQHPPKQVTQNSEQKRIFATTLKNYICLNDDFISCSTFIVPKQVININEQLKYLIMQSSDPQLHEKCMEITLQTKSLGNQYVSSKENLIKNLANFTNIQQFDQSKLEGLLAEIHDVSYQWQTLVAVKNQGQKILKDEILNEYSKLLKLIFQSYKQFSLTIGDVSYSIDNFLQITEMVVAKTIRDIKLQNDYDSDEEQESKDKSIVNFNSEFYMRGLLPSIYQTLSSGIHQEYIGLLQIIVALQIAYEYNQITDSDMQLFKKLFYNCKESFKWKSTFQTDKKIKNWSNEFLSFKGTIMKHNPLLEDLVLSMQQILERSNYKAQISKVFSKIVDGKFKHLPLFQRILISMHHPDSLTKRLLRQFIYTVIFTQTINDKFEFNEEILKLHSFIKTASWSKPIALFSRPGINIVNTICSLANYYSVGLEVIRTDPEFDDDQNGDNSETIELICRCAEEGTWVLISTTKFATFMEQTVSNLNRMRLRGIIVNTFRIFIDLQGLVCSEIPDNFLQQESVRFYMSEDNMEDLEGYNDIWNNILGEDIVRQTDIINDSTYDID